jgi:hypothetical protein
VCRGGPPPTTHATTRIRHDTHSPRHTFATTRIRHDTHSPRHAFATTRIRHDTHSPRHAVATTRIRHDTRAPTHALAGILGENLELPAAWTQDLRGFYVINIGTLSLCVATFFVVYRIMVQRKLI